MRRKLIWVLLIVGDADDIIGNGLKSVYKPAEKACKEIKDFAVPRICKNDEQKEKPEMGWWEEQGSCK